MNKNESLLIDKKVSIKIRYGWTATVPVLKVWTDNWRTATNTEVF